jgi:hypothetical protein
MKTIHLKGEWTMNVFHVILHLIGILAFVWVVLGLGVIKVELDELKLKITKYEWLNDTISVDEKGDESSEKSE